MGGKSWGLGLEGGKAWLCPLCWAPVLKVMREWIFVHQVEAPP